MILGSNPSTPTMALYLSYQPVDNDDMDSEMIWKIHVNPLNANTLLTLDVTDEEIESLVKDYFRILESLREQ